MASLKDYANKNAINEVLGSLLNDTKLLRQYELSNEDFPELFHRLIYAAINNLVRAGADELDAVAIDEYLSRYKVQYQTFKNNDGFQYVEMIKAVAKPANISYNYDQVRKFSLLRRYALSGVDVGDYFDPDDTDPDAQERRRAKLDNESISDIINHFKLRLITVASPFLQSESRDSKKAGADGIEQLEQWQKSTEWGIGYASAYLTTILHGMRPGTLTIRSGSTGAGKTRLSLADLAYACAPYYWDPKTEKWLKNPNGIQNGALYIGTEMELNSIDSILWAYMANVPEDHIKYNEFKPGEEERVRQAIHILENEANIWLEYLPDFTVSALTDVIEEHVLNHKVQHVFFDYIHSTPELAAEFAYSSGSKHMAMREDQVLLSLSTKLKQMSRDFGVSINTATQVNADFRDESIRDQTLVAGGKAVINKADNAMIMTRPTDKELKMIEPIVKEQLGGILPNLVVSVYKVRDGKYTNIKVWLYVDYSTMRVHDLFATGYDYKLVHDINKTYIHIWGEKVATSTPVYLQDHNESEEPHTEGLRF